MAAHRLRHPGQHLLGRHPGVDLVGVATGLVGVDDPVKPCYTGLVATQS